MSMERIAESGIVLRNGGVLPSGVDGVNPPACSSDEQQREKVARHSGGSQSLVGGKTPAVNVEITASPQENNKSGMTGDLLDNDARPHLSMFLLYLMQDLPYCWDKIIAT